MTLPVTGSMIIQASLNLQAMFNEDCKPSHPGILCRLVKRSPEILINISAV